MAWYFNNVRIFTQDITGDYDQIAAELNPLGGGSITHVFGYSDQKLKLNAFVIGDTDIVGLINSYNTGLGYTLVTPYATVVSGYLLKHFTNKQIFSNCQTVRPDLPEDSPVYVCDLELWRV